MVTATLPTDRSPALAEVAALTAASSRSETAAPPLRAPGRKPQPGRYVFDPGFVSATNGSEFLAFFETRSGHMQKVLAAANKAAVTAAPILLTGERGVGKSALARRIHEWSEWHGWPFIVVDCESLYQPPSQDAPLDRILAGGVGWSRDWHPPLNVPGGGTIFFDNFSHLCELGQARVLEFWEEQNFQSVFAQGGGTTYRIVAACDSDLRAEVAAGRFREDLFFRISIISLAVPPLRDRFEDLEPLASYLLANLSIVTQRPGLRFAPDSINVLARHSWPGNVRELRNVIECACCLSRGDRITARMLSRVIAAENTGELKVSPPLTSLEEVERDHIARVLSQTASLKEAAAILGIHICTLWRKRRQYNLTLKQLQPRR